MVFKFCCLCAQEPRYQCWLYFDQPEKLSIPPLPYLNPKNVNYSFKNVQYDFQASGMVAHYGADADLIDIPSPLETYTRSTSIHFTTSGIVETNNTQIYYSIPDTLQSQGINWKRMETIQELIELCEKKHITIEYKNIERNY